MDLIENPFYILGTSPGDDRLKIMDLAEEKSLLGDSSVCDNARSDLTNPGRRLVAEIAWMPGISPRRASQATSLLNENPLKLHTFSQNMNPITKANILAAGLLRLGNNLSVEKFSEWVLELALTFEEMDPEDILTMINEERNVAGFPEVTNLSLVEAELANRRQHFRKNIKLALDKLPSTDLVKVLTLIVETATDNGDISGPILIDDIVDSYEVEAQPFLEKERENIEKLINQIKCAAESMQPDEVGILIHKLEVVVKNWDIVAQPIQVSNKSRGHDHNESIQVAALIRSLAIHLYNDYGKLELSQKLTSLIKSVFAEVVDVAERASEDESALEEIAENQRIINLENKKREYEWRQKISYETELGVFFKDRLKISPEGIEWKGKVWDLESITRIRWGATQNSINGIPTGTNYYIFFGDDNIGETIDTRKETVFKEFIDRLWKAVGVRIFTEFLEGLRDGKRFKFDSAIVEDRGIYLEKKRNIFSSGNLVFCRWNELKTWNASGNFYIEKKDDDKVSVVLSYQDDDNTHILEAAIRAFWKRPGEKLSSLLER